MEHVQIRLGYSTEMLNWKIYQLICEMWVDLHSMKKQVMDIQGSQKTINIH